MTFLIAGNSSGLWFKNKPFLTPKHFNGSETNTQPRRHVNNLNSPPPFSPHVSGYAFINWVSHLAIHRIVWSGKTGTLLTGGFIVIVSLEHLIPTHHQQIPNTMSTHDAS